MLRKVAGTLVVLALAGFAGCGGGGGGDDEPTTKAEFIKRANAACAVEEPKPTTSSRTKGPQGFLTQLLAREKAVVDGLDEIDVPDDLNSDFASLKKGIQDRAVVIEKALAAVKANPKTKIEQFGEQAQVPQKRIASSARALGLKRCT